MLEFVKKYGCNIYSQNNEDGLIDQILSRLDITRGTAVEFGGADGFFCSNTAALRDKGWAVHMYDLQACEPYVKKKAITPANINELPVCDLLSIDTDSGNDYECFKEIKQKPAIVIIEINSSIPPHQLHVSDDQGASYKSMVELGLSKGYFLLAHTGNLVFVLNEYKSLFPEITGDPLYNHELYFNRSWL